MSNVMMLWWWHTVFKKQNKDKNKSLFEPRQDHILLNPQVSQRIAADIKSCKFNQEPQNLETFL